MRSIYNIKDDILNCYEEYVDEETGEIISMCVNKEALDKLEMEKEAKFEAVACWRKESNAMLEALREEKRQIDKRMKSYSNLCDSLDEYLTYHLDGKNFETPRVKVSFRNSESVVVEDIAFLPSEFLKLKEPEPNKMAIKKAIKSGKTIAGCHLEQKNNINYK